VLAERGQLAALLSQVLGVQRYGEVRALGRRPLTVAAALHPSDRSARACCGPPERRRTQSPQSRWRSRAARLARSLMQTCQTGWSSTWEQRGRQSGYACHAGAVLRPAAVT
jgi:hypothetical protein